MLDLTAINNFNKQIADGVYNTNTYLVKIYDMDLARNSYKLVKYWLKDIEVNMDRLTNNQIFQKNIDLMSDIEKFMLILLSFNKKCIIEHVRDTLNQFSYVTYGSNLEKLLDNQLDIIYKQLPDMLYNVSKGVSKQMKFNERVIEEMYNQCKRNYTKGQNTEEFLILIYNKAIGQR